MELSPKRNVVRIVDSGAMMMVPVRVLTICLVSVVAVSGCDVSFPNPQRPNALKATFNLSSLQVPGGLHAVGTHGPQSYNYVYQFCNEFSTRPSILCSNDTALGNVYQIEPHNGIDYHCQVVGHAYNVSSQTLITTAPDGRMTVGVLITYGNGDTCPDSSKRDLAISVWCDPTILIPASTLVVTEDAYCDYSLSISVSAGCPMQCPVTNMQTANPVLCGGHGQCEPDSTYQTIRCHCSGNWTGIDCLTPIHSLVNSSSSTGGSIESSTADSTAADNGGGLSPGAIAAIVMGVVLVSVGAVIFIVRTVRRTRTQKHEFANSGASSELGGVTISTSADGRASFAPLTSDTAEAR